MPTFPQLKSVREGRYDADTLDGLQIGGNTNNDPRAASSKQENPQ